MGNNVGAVDLVGVLYQVFKAFIDRNLGEKVGSFDISRVASGVRKINDYQFFVTILSTIYRLFDTLSTNFIDFSIFAYLALK